MMGCLKPFEGERMSIKDIESCSYINRVRKELLVDRKEEKELTITNYSSLRTFSSKTYIP